MDAFYAHQRHHENCPLDSTIQVLTGKWKSIILCRLADGEYRYTELLTSLQGCTRRMLSLQLQQLERDQIIVKTVDTTYVPTKTSYRLTTLGTSLIPIIRSMDAWGQRYLTTHATGPLPEN